MNNQAERSMDSGRVLFQALIILLTLVPGAFADPLPPPLTLDQCVRVALSDNPDQRIAESGIRAAAEEAGAAGAPYYPRLDLAVGYRRWDTHIFLPGDVGQPGLSVDTLGATDDWNASLEANYLLFDSGRRRAELEAARARQGAAGFNAESIRQRVVLLVHEAFNGLLAAVESRAAADAGLERSEEHLRLAMIRSEAGDVPMADVIRAQTEVADARLRLIRTEGGERVARAGLNRAMGRPAYLPLAIAGEGSPGVDPKRTALEEATRIALRQRPELAAAEKEAQVLRLKVTAARGAFGPKVQAAAKYGWRDTAFLPEDEDWSVGVFLKAPLFTGFARTHEVARQKIEAGRAEAVAARVALNIQREVAAAHAALLEAGQLVATTKTFMVDAEEGLRLTRARYEAGAGTINDLLDAEAALTGAEAAVVSAVFRQRISTARFLHALGEL